MTKKSNQFNSVTKDPTSEVLVLDTSLRDGEQAPGFNMNPEQKLKMAFQLKRLGVDIIEAGFAASSPGDFASVYTIAKEVKGVTIACLARASEEDIFAASKALEPAKSKRLHIFLATSPIHRKYKLKKTRQQVLKIAVEAVTFARTLFDDVQFSPEDAARTEPDYLVEVITAVIEAGATTVNLPDTVGYKYPEEMFELVSHVKANVPNIDKARISVHCHNDLGMAVANSLSALHAGARQVECTINGIGERAGNASLEEVVMALKTRHDYFGLNTNINTKQLFETSSMLCQLTGNPVPRNKAIVGKNAFAHEAGIHQHGVLQNAETYEIMKPEDVGVAGSSLVLGRHSGKHALKDRLETLNICPEEEKFDVFFDRFKALADTKSEVNDADLKKLVKQPQSFMPSPMCYAHDSIKAMY